MQTKPISTDNKRTFIVPVDICGRVEEITEVCKKLGFTFLEKITDELQYTYLPEGWLKKDNGNLWTEIVDEIGRTRAGIYCCGDNVFMTLTTAFLIKPLQNIDKAAVQVMRNNNPVYITKDYSSQFDCRSMAIQEASKDAKKWLDSNYPDWRNPAAYWDVE